MNYLAPIPKPDPREARLPVWAATLIGDLRVAATSAQAYAAEARLATKPDKSDTVLGFYSDHPIGLPAGEPVTFKLGPGRHPDRWIRVRNLGGGAIEVLGSSGLTIRPAVSNNVVITVDGA